MLTGSVKRVLMPQLSPSFERGALTKWRVPAGSAVKGYDAVFDVRTSTLHADARPTDAPHELIIETMDEGWLSKFLVMEGADVPHGALLAFIVEEESDLAILNAIPSEKLAGDLIVASAWLWQAHLKDPREGPNCGCS